MANDPITRDTKLRVSKRSGGVCERCGAEPASNYHHRRARGMGGTLRNIHTPDWLLHLCGSGTEGCHGYIETHPEISYEKGWKMRQYQLPSTSPVQTFYGIVILHRDGSAEPWI